MNWVRLFLILGLVIDNWIFDKILVFIAKCLPGRLWGMTAQPIAARSSQAVMPYKRPGGTSQ